MAGEIPKIVIKVESQPGSQQATVKPVKPWRPNSSYIVIPLIALLTALLLLPPIKGVIAKAVIEETVANPPTGSDIEISLRDYDLGYMSSQLSGTLVFYPDTDDEFAFDFYQDVEHGVDLLSPLQLDRMLVSTRLHLSDTFAERTRDYFPNGEYLKVSSRYQGGSVLTEFTSPEADFVLDHDSNLNIRWGGLRGSVVSNSSGGVHKLELTMPLLEMSDKGDGDYKVVDVKLDATLEDFDIKNLFSNVRARIGNIHMESKEESVYFAMSDIIFSVETDYRDTLLDWSTQLRGGQFEYDVDGESDKGMSFSYGLAVRNIHKPTVEKIAQALRSKAGFRSKQESGWETIVNASTPYALDFLQTAPEFHITDFSTEMLGGKGSLVGHVALSPQQNRAAVDYQLLFQEATFDVRAELSTAMLESMLLEMSKKAAVKLLEMNEAEINQQNINDAARAFAEQMLNQLVGQGIFLQNGDSYVFNLSNHKGKLLLNGREGVEQALLGQILAAMGGEDD